MPRRLSASQQQQVAWPFQVRVVQHQQDGRLVEDIEYCPRLRSELAKLYQAMLGRPTRARFRNFHMHVFARLSTTLCDLALEAVALGLVLRFVAESARGLLLVRIPKSDGGLRPLSVLHDLYCCTTAIAAQALNTATELARLLPAFMKAYRQGFGTPQAVTTVFGTMGDARRLRRREPRDREQPSV